MKLWGPGKKRGNSPKQFGMWMRSQDLNAKLQTFVWMFFSWNDFWRFGCYFMDSLLDLWWILWIDKGFIQLKYLKKCGGERSESHQSKVESCWIHSTNMGGHAKTWNDQKNMKGPKNHETTKTIVLSTKGDNFAQPDVLGIYIYWYVRMGFP